VALKLQQKGFVVMEKDPNDARITRIKLTDAIDSFGKESQKKSELFTEKLFDGITAEELAMTRSALEKLLANLEAMDRESK
jgi:DNA-binding MarR family transcriptional regulator